MDLTAAFSSPRNLDRNSRGRGRYTRIKSLFNYHHLHDWFRSVRFSLFLSFLFAQEKKYDVDKKIREKVRVSVKSKVLNKVTDPTRRRKWKSRKLRGKISRHHFMGSCHKKCFFSLRFPRDKIKRNPQWFFCGFLTFYRRSHYSSGNFYS